MSEELEKAIKSREKTKQMNQEVLAWIAQVSDDEVKAIPLLKSSLIASIKLLDKAMDLHTEMLGGNE